MSTMLIQKFINDNPDDWKARLTVEFGIKIREYPDRTVFNYDQLESPKMDPMVQECRGLILRNSDWSVMARSFNRFFNLGEAGTSEKTFPIHLATAFEKLDGSLITVYHDDPLSYTESGGKWCASTRSLAFAEGSVTYGEGTFFDLVEKAFGKSLQEEMKTGNPFYSYVFELTSPFNRVVTRYAEFKMTLLAVRRNSNDDDFSQKQCDMIARHRGWARPKTFSFATAEEVVSSLKDLPPLDEGYVLAVYDELTRSYSRVKVKNPSYLAVAHMRSNDGLNLKSVIKLVFAGDEGEYLTYYPEDAEIFTPWQDAFKKMHDAIHTTWAAHKDIEDQKTFALAVKDTGLSGILFQLRKGVQLTDILDRTSDDAKTQLLTKFKA